MGWFLIKAKSDDEISVDSLNFHEHKNKTQKNSLEILKGLVILLLENTNTQQL